MQESKFEIYNASAGSGKTYTLTKSYLKKLITAKNHDFFKSILALTFTNKAVGEMKERIIDMLKKFSGKNIKKEPHPMFKDICEELNIMPEVVINKSKTLLKHIIHNYGFFDIITIDGFTHRVIRTFAYDLKLPVNFEVELDQDRLLNEAVERLISKAGTEEKLTKLLVDFAIEKANEDKSWDLSYDFNKISKLLVNENDLTHIQSLKKKNLEDFNKLKELLTSNIKTIEKSIASIADNVLTLIEEYGLEFDDFSNKYLPKYFQNLKEKKFNPNYGTAWQENLLNGGNVYPKRVSNEVAALVNEIQPQLVEAFNLSKTLIYELKLNRGFYKNITPLSVLNSIKKELDEIKKEDNLLLISEFNKIISNEIKNQPTPFIYERLGEKYKHYFIDEFQDTSVLQWENLNPLIDNALSSINGSAMLVGDAKQAIYRWRGGDAEQFINLYNKTKQPFQVKQDVLNLSTNYRSASTIVNFNNNFFNFLSDHFSDPNHKQLYKQLKQQTNSKNNGYVNLSFLEINELGNTEELYCNEVFKTINHCINYGYTPKDICVIVRKRKEGIAVANYLNEKGLQITSSETLLLKNSPDVKFVNTFLIALHQPNNQILKVEILSYLANKKEIKDKHLFFKTHLKNNTEEFLDALGSVGYDVEKNRLQHLPLYELVEEIIRTFNIDKTSNAYILFYLDVVLEFTQKINSNLQTFINYFDKKKDILSIVSPENINAIKIMTIHKSKGLEFPVVIFPFAELNIYKELEPKSWVPVDKDLFNGFSFLLINHNKDIQYFGETGANLHDNRKAKLELDNLNLLYVVLTRPVNALFIISKREKTKKDIVNRDTYDGLLMAYINAIGKLKDNTSFYEFSTLEPRPKKEKIKKTESIDFISNSRESHNLSVVTKSGLLWDTKQKLAIERGNLIHMILSKIQTKDDVDFALNDLVFQGEIKKNQTKDLRDLILKVIEHPILSDYFSTKYIIYNEKDILTKNGEIIRPDRLALSENEAIIIDYKTGNYKSQHKIQLNNYAAVIKTMNYHVKHKFLVYLNENAEIVKV